MNFAGIDIGGANIKLATLDGKTKQDSFPFWKNKDGLGQVLNEFGELLSPNTRLGVTMTAELADCFASKQEGVEFVVDAVVNEFPNAEPLFYRTDGMMCQAAIAKQHWHLVAASNWHALACLAFADQEYRSGFVFDIGSTTTDIIPVVAGTPVIGEQNDLARLTNGQLFYAGVGRTPICSIVSDFQLSNGKVTIARELFATVADAFVWLGRLDSDEYSTDTADGRPATKRHAGQRLARMVCCDFDELGDADIDLIAKQTQRDLVEQISTCLKRVVNNNPELPLVFRTFGKGGWLVEDVIRQAFDDDQRSFVRVIPFSSDESVNQTAPALAVASRRQQVYLQSSVVHG